MVFPIIGARDYIDQRGFFIHQCESCGNPSIFAVYDTQRKLTLYFVPTLKVRTQIVMECMTCHNRWGVPKDQLPALKSGLMSQDQLSAYMASHQRLSPQYQLNLQPGERTLYQVLQVDPQAEPEVIDAAFKRLALKYHPDRQETGSTEAMRLLLEAKDVLSDPAKRAEYDRRIGIVYRVEALRPEEV